MALTAFFRDMQTLHYIAAHVVPAVVGRARIKVWDAGCASGEEPYSLAMVLAEHLGHFGFANLAIHATDHEESEFPQFREMIALGIYPELVLKTTPRPDLIRKYSRPAEKAGHVQIREEVRRHVLYERHDLLSYREIASDFSLVVCKNVLLHFQPPQQAEVVRMFHRALLPGGFLALDQAQRIPPDTDPLFENIAEGGFLYRRRGAA